MLTVSDEDRDLFTAIRNGAFGYLLKEYGTAAIVRSVGRSPARRSAHRWRDGEPKSCTNSDWSRQPHACARSPRPTLTAREDQVLKRVANGDDQSRGGGDALHHREHGQSPSAEHFGKVTSPQSHPGERVCHSAKGWRTRPIRQVTQCLDGYDSSSLDSLSLAVIWVERARICQRRLCDSTSSRANSPTNADCSCGDCCGIADRAGAVGTLASREHV